MPSSPRWAAHSSIHLAANSESASSRGMKLAAKALRRPAVLVPVICSVGISSTPMSARPATMFSSRISSRTVG